MKDSPDKEASKKLLGKLLLEKGLISKEQLTHALEVQEKEGGLIGQVLVKLGYLTEEDVVSALATQFGFPYLPLANYDIDPEVIKLVPENAARQYCLLPVDKIGNILTVVMADPLNDFAIRDIEDFAGCAVQVFVSTARDVKEAVDRYYGKKKMPQGAEIKPEEHLSKLDFLTTARKKEEGKKENDK